MFALIRRWCTQQRGGASETHNNKKRKKTSMGERTHRALRAPLRIHDVFIRFYALHNRRRWARGQRIRTNNQHRTWTIDARAGVWTGIDYNKIKKLFFLLCAFLLFSSFYLSRQQSPGARVFTAIRWVTNAQDTKNDSSLYSRRTMLGAKANTIPNRIMDWLDLHCQKAKMK